MKLSIKPKDFLMIPNILSLSRIFLLPLWLYFLSIGDLTHKILCLLVSAIIILTDFLDGYLGRKLNQISDLGRILDPIADKIAALVGIIGLIIFRGFPIWIFIIIITRDILVLAGSQYVMWKKKIVLESNIFGKISTNFLAYTAVFLIIEEFYYLTAISLAIALIFIALSSISYLITFMEEIFAYKNKKLLWIICSALLLIGIFFSVFFYSMRDRHYDISEIASEKYKYPDPSIQKELAEKYAPFFQSKDLKLPINLDNPKIVNNFSIIKDKGLFSFIFKEKVEGLEENLNSFLVFTGSTSIQNLSNLYKIYARVIENTETGHFIIQYYFMFFNFTTPEINEGTDEEFLIEGTSSWKLIQFVLDKNLKLTGGIILNYPYGTVSKSEDIKFVYERPTVFISDDNFNCYFQNKDNPRYFDKNKELFWGRDSTTSNISNYMKKLNGYEIEIIDSDNKWIQYDGYWGDCVFKKSLGPMLIHPNNKKLAVWHNPLSFYEYYKNLTEKQ